MDRGALEEWTGREVARLLALVEAEREYYRGILSALPLAAVTVSEAGRIVAANTHFRRNVQSGAGPVNGKSLAQVIGSAKLQDSVEQCVRTRLPSTGVPVEVGGSTYRAAVTPIDGWQEGDRDVLITLEQTVEDSPAALPKLDAARLPALVWTINSTTLECEWVEGTGGQLLGYSVQHWLSTPGFWLERIHADDRARVEAFYRSAAAVPGEYGCEYRALTAAGAEVWRRDAFSSQPEQGRLHGLTLDAQARREAEQDHITASRVDAVGGLARQLSHDLNNALMVVTGYAEEAMSHFSSEDPRRADLQAILSAAETMAGIAGELHGFARQQAAPALAVEVGPLLESVGARIREELGASLVLKQADKPVAALAAATQLEAVLMSIARRLRDKTDPHMILAAREAVIPELTNREFALEPGRYIEIAVRGPYPCEVPAAGFETLLSGKDPHGSDMARAYAIVRQWGGTVFTGRTGHLSEVRVLLPFAPEPEHRTAVRSETLPPSAKHPGTVLVVEDEAGIRALIHKILTRAGYAVVEASSAEEALELARQQAAPVRLLITDLKLPGQGGRELAHTLGLDDPNLRVLYISGYTDDPAHPADMGPGAAFLQKPFTLAALMSKVREALGAVGY